MKTFVASDVEGTLSTGTFALAIGDYLSAHGRKAQYRAYFYKQLPSFVLNKLNVIETQRFKNNWFLGVARLLKGFSLAQILEMGEWIIETDLWQKRRANVIEELRQHQANGATLILASGLYQPVLEQFAKRVGNNVEAIGTPLEFVDGVFTGNMAGDIGVGQRKADQVRERIAGSPLLSAYGDTSADEMMLAMAQHPVAVHPDAALRKIATERGWRILATPI